MGRMRQIGLAVVIAALASGCGDDDVEPDQAPDTTPPTVDDTTDSPDDTQPDQEREETDPDDTEPFDAAVVEDACVDLVERLRAIDQEHTEALQDPEIPVGGPDFFRANPTATLEFLQRVQPELAGVADAGFDVALEANLGVLALIDQIEAANDAGEDTEALAQELLDKNPEWGGAMQPVFLTAGGTCLHEDNAILRDENRPG